jgi:hypothetical protein
MLLFLFFPIKCLSCLNKPPLQLKLNSVNWNVFNVKYLLHKEKLGNVFHWMSWDKSGLKGSLDLANIWCGKLKENSQGVHYDIRFPFYLLFILWCIACTCQLWNVPEDVSVCQQPHDDAWPESLRSNIQQSATGKPSFSYVYI